ncbi:MAG: agmatine deiminase family protein [Clostridia bacterium]|nr:agmatine deiminase family protein [Clostridia bacterium]
MRLPAEWEKKSGGQLTWPHCETDWYALDKVLECYVDIALNILRFEPLLIVCRDEAEARGDIARVCSARGMTPDLSRVTFVEAPLNDTWARDHGGIAVHGDNGEKYLYDFVFNGWGLKFGSDLDNQLTKNIFNQGVFQEDVLGVDMRPFVLEGGSIDCDGQGTLLTTTQCLTSVNRNEYLTRDEIEGELCTAFGLKRVLWLDHGDIIGDDTDGHIDTLARFCNAETIEYVQCTDPDDPHYEELGLMERQLRSFRTLDGGRYKLVPLPLPEAMWLDDYRLPASYANFLIVNGGVMMPGYGSACDEVARQALQAVFPDREVVVVGCSALLSGHGSLHCVTMNFPVGWLP